MCRRVMPKAVPMGDSSVSNRKSERTGRRAVSERWESGECFAVCGQLGERRVTANKRKGKNGKREEKKK